MRELNCFRISPSRYGKIAHYKRARIMILRVITGFLLAVMVAGACSQSQQETVTPETAAPSTTESAVPPAETTPPATASTAVPEVEVPPSTASPAGTATETSAPAVAAVPATTVPDAATPPVTAVPEVEVPPSTVSPAGTVPETSAPAVAAVPEAEVPQSPVSPVTVLPSTTLLEAEVPVNNAAEGDDDAIVPSDMFSGIVEFSDAGVASGVDIDDVFSRPRHRASPRPGDYALELRDASGEVVRSVSFSASVGVDDLEPGSGPRQEPAKAVFSFVVSNPPEYSSFAIKHDNSEVLVVNRSASEPSVSVSGPAAGQFFGAGSDISVSWSGSDADDDELSYRVYYSTDGGTTYVPLSLRTEDTARTLPADRLQGSTQARIGVSVSDGARSSFAETPVFSVANHAPEVSIRRPGSGRVLAGKQGFVVEAWAYDKEDGLLWSSIVWESNKDGNLGTGRYLVLSAADFTPGSNVITATVTDSSGVSASDSVTVVITLHNALPVANDDNVEVAVDEEVLIDALANDVDVEGDVDLPSFRIVQPPQLGFVEKARTSKGMRIKYYSNTSGRDNFSYIICDAVDRCDTAQVNIEVGLADCTVLGTEEDDILQGTSGDDVICGLGGNDTIDGMDGADVIRGGLGDDTIYGGAGDDVIYGEPGNDFIFGHNGSDTIYGGPDDDTIYGGSGVDMIFGGHGLDDLFGGHGLDDLFGESEDDIIEPT